MCYPCNYCVSDWVFEYDVHESKFAGQEGVSMKIGNVILRDMVNRSGLLAKKAPEGDLAEESCIPFP